MDERRNQYIVGGVILLVVASLILIVATRGGGPVCDLQLDQPKLDLTKLKTLSSIGDDALLKFAGYVKYELEADAKDKNAYLLLDDKQSVGLKKDDKDHKSSLSINAECGTITLDVEPSGQDQLKIGQVTLDLVKANGENKSCTMDFGASYDKNKHYRCNKEKTYLCTVKSKDAAGKEQTKTVATLSVAYLEFELNGTPESVKEGKFTTGEDDCK